MSRVRHSPSEIRYVSENEVPAPKATRNATYVLAGASVSGAIPRPWLPNRRKIVHEPVRYPITATLQARPAPGHDDDKPIWRPTNPNSRRPYNVRELESNFKFELEAPSSRQRLRRAAKRSRSRPVLNGPWIPSDVRYSKGVGWGTINPFPPYDPYEVADFSSA